jgi:hypothetical protein
MAIINDGVTIDSGLEASVMRRKMESKDTLATKGALYVGTGIPDDDSFTVTKSIAPSGADDDGNVLVADSKETVGWRISDTCPKAEAVTTDIGTQKITDIFESDGKTAKSATIAKGLQSNTAQTTNGTNWYEFNGTNEYFGSTNSPTIIKTSEARPKAFVTVKNTTGVQRELALLDDVGVQKSEWVQNNDNNPFPQTGWYLITEMQVANFTLAPFIAMVTVRDDKIVALSQDIDGYDVTLRMTIGGNLKFADDIKAHKYTISGSTVTAQSQSLSVATLLNEGSFYFAYKFLFGSD